MGPIVWHGAAKLAVMVRFPGVAALIGGLLLVAAAATAPSPVPQAPPEQQPATPTLPNGNTATEQELVAAMKDVKAYQASVAEYRACLDRISAGLTAEGLVE